MQVLKGSLPWLRSALAVVVMSYTLCSKNAVIPQAKDCQAGVAKQQEAVILMKRGKYADSLAIFLHLLDEGQQYGEQFNQLKGSFLLLDIKRLADLYPSARIAIRRHLDALLQQLENVGYDGKIMGHISFLAETFHLESVLVSRFPGVLNQLEDDYSRREWGYQCLGALLKDRRYRLIADNIDLVTLAERQVGRIERELTCNSDDRSSALILADIARQTIDSYLELYSGQGRLDQARRIRMQKERLLNLAGLNRFPDH